jgi:hypothetical protein
MTQSTNSGVIAPCSNYVATVAIRHVGGQARAWRSLTHVLSICHRPAERLGAPTGKQRTAINASSVFQLIHGKERSG